MAAIDSYARRLAPPGSLLGVSTIHFVKWLVIDDGRRLMMVSDYDGFVGKLHRRIRRDDSVGPPLFDAGIVAGVAADGAQAVLSSLVDDGCPRGIHFFCVNASIRNQFEFVQQTWCNNPRFAG